MRKRVQGGQQEVPLIHRTMSVEIAVKLIRELEIAFRYIPQEEFRELEALQRDLRSILRQLESGDVKRSC